MLEEITYNPLAKFQILTEPLQNPPHKCCGCGRYSSGDPENLLHFVDMGFDLEFLGEVFICIEGCFREVMNQLGVLTREQTLKIQSNIDYLTKENERLLEENKEFNDAMGSVTRAIRSGIDRADRASTSRQESKPIVPPGVNPKADGGKKGFARSTDERGSTSLSNHEGDDLLGEI